MSTEINKYLQKILVSSEFKNAVKYQKLLEYLVNSSLNGIVPKEVTIAYDVYNIEFDNSASGESNIRVYVHSLRKKLDLYYANEGKDDKIQLVITKGAYKVEFIEKKSVSAQTPKRNPLIITIIIALLIGNLVLLFLYLKDRPKNSSYSNYVWKDFLHSELPILVVIGDYYLVKDNSIQNHIRYTRDSRINSDVDFNEFLKEFPQFENKSYKTKHTLLGKYAPFCLIELTNILKSTNKSFEIILASDFQWSNIQNYNIIYIGSFKSLGIMNELLKKSNFEFKVLPNELKFHQLNPDSVFYYYSFDSDIDHAYESDYSVVTKIPGTDNSNILFFLSTRDIGLIATVRYFTNEKSLVEFENTYFSNNKMTPFFEVSFKIQGLQRNIRSIDLMNVNKDIGNSFSPSDKP